MLTAKSVLVLAPHADDETLGAGGTLLRLRAQGADLHWVLMTTAEGAGFDQTYVTAHKAQIAEVAASYPFATVNEFGYPASSLASQPMADIVDRLRRIASELRPDIVLIPHEGDAHDDHGVTARAAKAAFKSFRMGAFGIRALYSMEIISETGALAASSDRAFLPNTIVDISEILDQKLAMFELFRTEIQASGPRALTAIRAQAVLHGAENGLGAAERFQCLHQIM